MWTSPDRTLLWLRKRSACLGKVPTTSGRRRTNNHRSELETLPNTFPVDLVWEVGETDVTHQLFTNDRGNSAGVTSGNKRRAGPVGQAIGGDIAVVGGGVRVRHLEESQKEGEGEGKAKKYF